MFQQQFQKSSSNVSTGKQKSIYLILNGSPNKIITYSYKSQIIKQQIQKLCQKHWQVKFSKSIRFFTIQGVQYQNQDLQMIKHKQRVYISKGEDFDCEMNFGQYKIIKPLGQGGFGKVVLAQNIITKQLAAVKIIKVQKICGASDIDMIFRQIQNLKALKHPNIVKIINCYILKNMQVYVVMQYLQGGELLKLLREQKFLNENQAKHIFQQIVSAICYCHRENIIHRDLKVENILFKNHQEKFIKIADFGISGVADQFNPDFDSGTLKYMAPEVLTAKQKSNNTAVDVWACGVILFYMLCGYLPFNGGSNSQIIHSICEGKYVYPKQAKISFECRSLIQCMLTVNPKKRIKMQQIRDNLWLINHSNNNSSRNVKLKKQFKNTQSELTYEPQMEDIIDSINNKKSKFNVLEKDLIIQQEGLFDLHENQFINSKNMKILSQKSEIQSIMQKRLKNGSKPTNFVRNQRKHLLNPLQKFPKRLQKQKQQIIQQLQAYNNKYYQNNVKNNIKNNLFRGNGIMITGGGRDELLNVKVREKQKQKQKQKEKGPANRSNYCSQELHGHLMKNIRRAHSKEVYRMNENDRFGNNSKDDKQSKEHFRDSKDNNNNKAEQKSRQSGDSRVIIKKRSAILNNWK